jgi:polyisoprenyl-phosphate glycosyltransferase
VDGVRYSFVLPVFNEQETLLELYERLAKVADGLDGASEMIFVDDNSDDGTYQLLLELQSRDPRCKIIRLARNFGHQIAISAGLDHASGDAVVVMDADLQDPPEVVPELIERWQEGYEVVYAVREHREQEPWLKRMTAAAFYRVIARLSSVRLPVDVGDFRLVDRRALDAFRSMPERRRYVRGMFAWVGFNQTGVAYARSGRFAGEPKYSFAQSARLAVDGVVSFSNAPLRLALFGGFLFSLLSFLGGVTAVVAKLAGAFTVPGWASIIVAVTFLGGLQLILMGMMGLYIGRIYDEVKARPLYVVRERVGLGEAPSPTATETPPLAYRD